METLICVGTIILGAILFAIVATDINNIIKKRMNNDNYPSGAANDPRAPYNQVEPNEEEFEFDISTCLTRKVKISSTEYEGGYWDKVEGYYEPTNYIGDFKEDFKNQCYTITDLLTEFANLLDYTLSNHTGIGRGQIVKYRQMKEECEAWIKNNDEEIETL